jgi:hypothetical protein
MGLIGRPPMISAALPALSAMLSSTHRGLLVSGSILWVRPSTISAAGTM